jgi:putative endonuclease
MVDLPAQAGAHFVYYVYVLKSTKENWHYVGLTNNLSKRLTQHNLGQTTSTKAHKPFKLLYKKAFPDRISARDYEKFLKIHSNKEKLLASLQIAEVAKW